VATPGFHGGVGLIKKIPPWLDIFWQETKKTFPELVEGNIIKINKKFLVQGHGLGGKTAGFGL